MAGDEKREESVTEAARRAAVEQAVTTIVYIAVTMAASWAILNRDAVQRLWTRLRKRPVTAQEARARRLIAELRRDITRWEHGDNPPARPKGLYEQ
jgi:hypothetical protein